MAAIDLRELESELSRTRAMFEAWAGGMSSSAAECKASHLAKLRASTGELAALNVRYQRAEKQAAQVRQQMAQDTKHEQALQETADSLIAEQHALQKRLQQMQGEVDAESVSVQQLQAEVAAARGEYELRMAKLEQLHAAYQDCLGLRLLSHEGELSLEFSQVDPREPHRAFGFAVRVLPGDAYTVTRCEPELPGRARLEASLLGEAADFAGFVRAMRRGFRALVDAEVAAAAVQDGAAASAASGSC